MATAAPTENITIIPNEILKLIPIFSGDKRQLSFFIRQCEFVIARYAGNGNITQNAYVMHSIMSRLVDNAAALVSERQDIFSWDCFKRVLKQHFGDPRNEECIAIELESLKIRSGESFSDFCNRIQSVRSVLISKVNLISDIALRTSKVTIYTNTSLNVFLYNLPENMVRIVRLKAPQTLEEALGIVMEEVNFHEQYNARNKIYNKPQNVVQPPITPQTPFKFGLPANQLNQYRPAQPTGYKPNLGYRPPFGQNNQMGMRPQQFGMRPHQFGNRPQQFNQSQQFGYRPQQYGMRPQQFGMHPQNAGMRPQNQAQFGYKPLYNQNANQDVSMRTAPPLKMQQGFKLNEMECQDPSEGYYHDYYYDNTYENSYCDYAQEQYDYNNTFEGPYYPESKSDDVNQNTPECSDDVQAQNFHMRFATDHHK